MGIVVITVSGDSRRALANSLHYTTDGAVDLVIIQKPKHRTFLQSLTSIKRVVGWRGLPKELWYALMLRMNARTREALSYVRGAELPTTTGEKYLAPTLEVDSVNSDEVYRALQAHSPDLLVVWGSALLQPRIIATAKQAINLHMGYCPQYRGMLANHHAILKGDFTKIGATIHHISHGVDTGYILALIPADTSKPPRELFRDLNTRAREEYVHIATRLFHGENLPTTKQSHRKGETLLFKQWVPSLRHEVGRKILQWEKEPTLSWHKSPFTVAEVSVPYRVPRETSVR